MLQVFLLLCIPCSDRSKEAHQPRKSDSCVCTRTKKIWVVTFRALFRMQLCTFPPLPPMPAPGKRVRVSRHTHSPTQPPYSYLLLFPFHSRPQRNTKKTDMHSNNEGQRECNVASQPLCSALHTHNSFPPLLETNHPPFPSGCREGRSYPTATKKKSPPPLALPPQLNTLFTRSQQ